MKKIISLIVVCLILCACSKGFETITRAEATKLIDDGAILLDVRTTNEYESGHILDAINIPLDNLDSIDIDLDQTIIVYCASGVRSKEAAEKLIDMGYTKVYNLDGGLLNWGDE